MGMVQRGINTLKPNVILCCLIAMLENLQERKQHFVNFAKVDALKRLNAMLHVVWI